MFCASCMKLNRMTAERICLRCRSRVFYNISVICQNCATKERICSACLKKVNPVNPNPSRGCGCGGKI